ncbi:MAG: hypothetical protein JWM51_1610 [Microbacteriaceae bacterium]|nr:hypothetical protein [Microbacteriaceae bacterium]
MAAVDEIVFHQLLAWHHFYDRATSDLALVSEGLLHAAELIALVAGFFLLAAARHREFSPIAATRFSRSRFSVTRRPAPRLPPPSSAR